MKPTLAILGLAPLVLTSSLIRLQGSPNLAQGGYGMIIVLNRESGQYFFENQSIPNQTNPAIDVTKMRKRAVDKWGKNGWENGTNTFDLKRSFGPTAGWTMIYSGYNPTNRLYEFYVSTKPQLDQVQQDCRTYVQRLASVETNVVWKQSGVFHSEMVFGTATASGGG